MRDVIASLLSPAPRHRVVGLEGGARAWLMAQRIQQSQQPMLAVCADEDSADTLARDAVFFLGAAAVLRVPADEVLPWDELVPDATIAAERLGALSSLANGAPGVTLVVLSARAMVRRVLPVEVLANHSWQVTVGEECGRDETARRLTEAGYRNVPLVEDIGGFSLRGDILDVWPPRAEAPLRLEFFGDTLESLRRFDAGTQRTLESVTAVALSPARELLLNAQTRSFAERTLRDTGEALNWPTSRLRERIEQLRDGLTSGLEALVPGFFEGGLCPVWGVFQRWAPAPLVWLEQPQAIETALDALDEEVERSYSDALRRKELALPPNAHFVERPTLTGWLAAAPRIENGLTLDAAIDEAAPLTPSIRPTRPLREAIASHQGETSALSPLLEQLSRWKEERLRVVFAAASAGQADKLRRLLAENSVPTRVLAEAPQLSLLEKVAPTQPGVMVGELSSGFVDTVACLAVVTDDDVFGHQGRRSSRRRKSAVEGFAASFKDLNEGDVCVHRDFGVCRYAGLTTMQVNGVVAEFLVLQFAGRDKVYLPVGRLKLISQFSGGDPSKASLDKLGAGTWEKKKLAVKEQLLKMAAELLQLYAQRRAHPGFAFSAPDRYFHQFEADFEFEETPDQQKAIDEVIADMQRPTPMDRLVCGDVGYGKTEVAMRAAFKAVLDRKQVAILVPTTLLAHQHVSNFAKRFNGYPVTVDVVSGLRSASETKDVFRRAREGRVDVVIGTHKMLSADLSFRDLGLLVVDEEQKFGVKQKEQLKRLKTNVDTLTLSATPIPRTLNMAMSGMRDLSIIATPPADRRAIRTFINRFDTNLITEAITRELQRGGQVFFIHNRVQSIGSMEKLLRELVPHASIAVAHGQMPEGALEKVMMAFIEKRVQVLLCTSIVESGIDIGSANTMLVNRADQFGLSQLYQLRGRVGRSKERAYAYLMVPHGRAVSKDAQRRLEVLQAFTELGAGFSIASHDLEIRGAGSLLGKEQSGSIEAVGFELYAQLLDEAVHEVRGEPVRQEVEPEINLPVPAYLPELYVPDVHQRLVLYKRLAQCSTADELEDLRVELIDRFGELPAEAEYLFELMVLRQEMRRLALRQLDVGAKRLVVTLGQEARLDGDKLLQLISRSRGLYSLTPELKVVVGLDATVKGEAYLAVARKALSALASVARI
jgi:transcription-repair coupling factor (superfamily II helicase)